MYIFSEEGDELAMVADATGTRSRYRNRHGWAVNLKYNWLQNCSHPKQHCLTMPTIIRSTQFWHSDGSVVLQSENRWTMAAQSYVWLRFSQSKNNIIDMVSLSYNYLLIHALIILYVGGGMYTCNLSGYGAQAGLMSEGHPWTTIWIQSDLNNSSIKTLST